MNVFYGLYRSANLDVDVSLVSTNQIRVIRHHSTIIEHELLSRNIAVEANECYIVRSTSINEIFVLQHQCLIRKRSRISFRTDREAFATVFAHAESRKIVNAAETVSHDGSNDVRKFLSRIRFRKGKFDRDNLVNSRGVQKSIFRM